MRNHYNTIARNIRAGDIESVLGEEMTVTGIRRNRRSNPQDRTVTINYSGRPDRTVDEDGAVTIVEW